MKRIVGEAEGSPEVSAKATDELLRRLHGPEAVTVEVFVRDPQQKKRSV
jgi:hypothetical protein